MDNQLLWLVMLGINFIGILGVYRFFGRIGLYAWVPMSVIIANLQVVKTIEIFGITASLGNIVYASIFLATDILSENHGKRDASRAVGLGFIALIFFTLMMNLAIFFKPAPVDFAQKSMKSLYALLPRIALGSLIAFAISQYYDIWTYSRIKKLKPETRWIWLRNNLSTLTSQALDTGVFCSIVFIGSIPVRDFIQIFFSTYVLKAIVAVADTPMVYLAKSWYMRGKMTEK